MLKVFTNRRRAKDAVLSLCHLYGPDKIQVAVNSGRVFLFMENPPSDIDTITHFGEQSDGDIGVILMQATEIYRGEGVRRFRA